MVSVTLPEMGESVTEGSIVEWRKKVGDYVTEGDALVDVTTDKVDVEVPATASGTIAQIHRGRRRYGFGRRGARGNRYVESPGQRRRASRNGSATPREPKIVEVTLPEMGESVTEARSSSGVRRSATGSTRARRWST